MVNEKIWNKVLNKEEEIKYNFSIGSRYIKFNLIFWGILSAPLIFITDFGVIIFLLIVFYFAFYLRLANAYAFTSKRIIIHTGWLSTQTVSVDYAKITDIHIKEPFFERIITNTGSIAINTAGSSGLEVFLKHIERPYEVKKILDEVRAQF